MPTLTIAAKNLATEMTNYNVEEKDLQGETAITVEHVEIIRQLGICWGRGGLSQKICPHQKILKIRT